MIACQTQKQMTRFPQRWLRRALNHQVIWIRMLPKKIKVSLNGFLLTIIFIHSMFGVGLLLSCISYYSCNDKNQLNFFQSVLNVVRIIICENNSNLSSSSLVSHLFVLCCFENFLVGGITLFAWE